MRGTARTLALIAVWSLLLLVQAGCGDTEAGGEAALEDLCEGAMEGPYLDFYFDDLRTRQPDLWSRVLSTCRDTCPASDACGPVRSVASWYGEWPQEETETP